MKITDGILDKVAGLAKLSIADEEREAMKADFQKMLDFVDKLQEVDTEGVEPLIHVHEQVNQLAEDTPVPPLSSQEALKNAPDKSGDFFRVPKVVDKDNP